MKGRVGLTTLELADGQWPRKSLDVVREITLEGLFIELVRFTNRRQLYFAHVPSHFKRGKDTG